MAEKKEEGDAIKASPTVPIGALAQSLMRKNHEIKADRAKAVIQSTQTTYKRAVEDLELKIADINMQLDAALDLAPDNAMSLVPNLKNHVPTKFVGDDLSLIFERRNLVIQFEEAKARYEYLFGPYTS